MTPSRLAATLGLVLILAGCGTTFDPDRIDQYSEETIPANPVQAAPEQTEAPEPEEPDVSASELLADWRRDVVDQNTGTIEVSVDMDTVDVAATFDYRLDPPGLLTTIRTTIGPQSVVVDGVSTSGSAWIKIRTQGFDTGDCSIQVVDEGASPLGELSSLDALPPALQVMATAKARNVSPDGDLNAGAFVYDVLSTISGSAPLSLGLDRSNRTTTPIEVTVADGRITGWQTDPGDAIAAVRIVNPPTNGGVAPGIIRSLPLSSGRIGVTIDPSGEPVAVREPTPAKTVDATRFGTDQVALLRAIEECKAR